MKFSKKFIVTMAVLATMNTPQFSSAESLRKQSNDKFTFTTPAGLTLNMDDLNFVQRHLEEKYPGAPTFTFEDLVAAVAKIEPVSYTDGDDYHINRGKCLFLLQVIDAKLSELKMDDHFSFVEHYGPSICGTARPTSAPTTDEPTTDSPTLAPITKIPSKAPTDELESSSPPSVGPSLSPTHKPSSPPSVGPSFSPTRQPTSPPSANPTLTPTSSPFCSTSSPEESCQGNKTFSCCKYGGNPFAECGSVTVDCPDTVGNYNYTAINAACDEYARDNFRCDLDLPDIFDKSQPATVCKPQYTCEFTCCGGGGGGSLYDGESCGSSNTALCPYGFDFYGDGNPCGSCLYINTIGFGNYACCRGQYGPGPDFNYLGPGTNDTTCFIPEAPCYGVSCGPKGDPDCDALPKGFGLCASDNGTVVCLTDPEELKLSDVGILPSGIWQSGGHGERKLLEDASYDPTPEEVMQVADESNGDLDSEFVLQDNLLTPEECDVLVAYTDEHDGVPVSGSADQDHVIMFRKKSPLEDIIGLERAKDLYKYFKEHTNGAPVTQVWLRRLSSKSGLSMKLHTDHQPYQLKIALNGNFEGGDAVVGDRTGANRIHLEPGAGILHDKGLVHGHMPHSNGDKYILYLISDANPSSMKDLAAETLALVVDASRVINDISGTEEMLN